MRGKRSKQYRKLMQQLSMTFGFRQPYQVLVDADFVRDTTRCKMDLVASLERTLHGKVKPLITQCSIRHLYATNSDPTVAAAIETAKTLCERRRCGHHPDAYPEPLPTLDCLSSVVDPGKSGTNKHRYCVASQDVEVRRAMRGVKGVPLVYVARSVMIMEPVSAATALVRHREEAAKFRDGIRARTKRKRGGDEDGPEARSIGSGSESGDGEDMDEEEGGKAAESLARAEYEPEKQKQKRRYGPKGPNPLAVKKAKGIMPSDGAGLGQQRKQVNGSAIEMGEPKAKRKRRKKHKAGDGGEGNVGAEAPGEMTLSIAAEA